MAIVANEKTVPVIDIETGRKQVDLKSELRCACSGLRQNPLGAPVDPFKKSGVELSHPD